MTDKSSSPSATLDADLIRRAAEILKQPQSAPLDQVIVPRGLWEQIANRLETAASERGQCKAILVDSPGVGEMKWCEAHGIYFGKDQSCPYTPSATLPSENYAAVLHDAARYRRLKDAAGRTWDKLAGDHITGQLDKAIDTLGEDE